MPSAVVRNDVDSRFDELGADRGHLVAVVRMHYQLEGVGVVAARDLGIGNGMVVARFPCDERSEAVMAPIDEIEIEVIRKWSASISPCCSDEQFVDHSDVVAFHLSLNLETPHELKLSPQVRAGRASSSELIGRVLHESRNAG